jgi:hypothetical protein
MAGDLTCWKTFPGAQRSQPRINRLESSLRALDEKTAGRGSLSPNDDAPLSNAMLPSPLYIMTSLPWICLLFSIFKISPFCKRPFSPFPPRKYKARQLLPAAQGLKVAAC